MAIEISEEHGMEIEVFSELPPGMEVHSIPLAQPILLKGDAFMGLMQEFKGNGFSAWYTRFWTSAKTILRARGDIPFLELRIALDNQLVGTWDKIDQAELQPYHFNLSFTPYVETRAIFEPDQHWATFDIHFDISMLESLGLEYNDLDIFLRNVVGGKAAELSRYAHRCPVEMQEAIHFVLKNPMSWRQPKLMESKIHEILMIALETVASPDHPLKVVLTPREIEGLHLVKALIESSIPERPENAVLCRKCGLNEFKLKTGFKFLFGTSIQEYHMALKFLRAKELLESGEETIAGVAYLIGYEHASSFTKQFRRRIGSQPKTYLKRKKN